MIKATMGFDCPFCTGGVMFLEGPPEMDDDDTAIYSCKECERQIGMGAEQAVDSDTAALYGRMAAEILSTRLNG